MLRQGPLMRHGTPTLLVSVGVAVLVSAILMGGATAASSAADAVPPTAVQEAADFAISEPVRDLPTIVGESDTATPPKLGTVAQEQTEGADDGATSPPTEPTAAMPNTNVNFEGISNFEQFQATGYSAGVPDTNGDVGPNHYIQWVNRTFAIWDKTGTKLRVPSLGIVSGPALEDYARRVTTAIPSFSTTGLPTGG